MTGLAAFRRSKAVVIGVDHYSGGIPVLTSAVNDARRLGEILEAEHGYEVEALLDAEASLAALDDLLTRRLPDTVGRDDRVLFYFAGHGIALDGEDGPNGYVLPHDARPREPDTYLEMTRLHDALMALPCRHMLIVLDSCFSGAFRWSSMRDVVRAPQVIHRERFDRFVRDPAWQVLTSAAYDQTAADQLLSGSLGGRGSGGAHSPFAIALFEALAGAADLAPAGGDGVITATELYLYLEERLQPETISRGRRQTPGLWPLRKHDKGEYIFRVPGRELDLPPAPELTYENNPYRGLSSYDTQDAPVFFGRDAVVEDLARSVNEQPLTVVLGASGTGKSSLVKAGLIPHLEAKGGWKRLAVVRPGDAPFQAMARALSADRDVAESAEAIVNEIRRIVDAEDGRHLLVVDQFEELITLTRSPAVRAAFVELLADLLEPRGRTGLHIAITLRTDFEAQFDRSRLVDLWHAGRFIVPPMSRQDYRAIIEGPASHRVLYFEPSSLVENLLDDVVAMPGGLPLLSFTLSELYRRYVERGGDDRSLTQEDYDALGGVAGALRSRADAEVNDLDSAHQETLRRLMLRMLVLEQGTMARQRVTRSELAHWDAAESDRISAVLDRLSGARLLVEGVATDGSTYVEPAHDALVNSWGRLLEWTHAAQSREPDLHFLHALARAALDWEHAAAGSRPGLLWRDKVRSARLWALRRTDRMQLNQLEDRFCRASVARRRFVRNGVAVLLTAITASGILATGLGFVADRQRVEAVAQRDEAQRQTLSAWSNELLLKAGTALDDQGNATLAFKLAAAAFQADSLNQAAVMLMRKALYGSGLLAYQGGFFAAPLYQELASDAGWVRWSPDGRHIAVGHYSVSGTDSIEILSVDGKSRARVPGFEETRFSSDGAYLLLDPGARMAWNGQDDERPGPAFDLDGNPVSASFAATLERATGPGVEAVGENDIVVWYAAVSADGRIRAAQDVRWDDNRVGAFEVRQDGNLINVVPGTWNATALSWDGRYLATGNSDGTVALWQVVVGAREATPLAELWRGTDRITGLEFSPDGTKLLVLDVSGAVRVWHLTANPLSSLPHRDDGPVSQRFLPLETPDGRYRAAVTNAGDYDATITFEDRQSGEVRQKAFSTGLSEAVMAADGAIVASSNGNQTWFLAPDGVEAFSADFAAAVNGMTADQGALLLTSYWGAGEMDGAGRWRSGWQGDLVVPLAPRAMIATADSTGQLALTPAEQARTGVADILDGLRAMAATRAAPGSLLGLLAQSVREVFARADTGVDADTTVDPADTPGPVVALPDAWRALDPARADTEGDGNGAGFFVADPDPEFLARVRFFLADLRDSGAWAAVRRMGPPPAFRDGPHTDSVFDLNSETFGRYNPEFVRWLEENLVPADRASPLRAVTQPLYDRRVRRVARIHALALVGLESDSVLRSTVTATYDTLSAGRGDYLRRALVPVATSTGIRPEGEPEDFADAAGFWIRRDLDGTTPDFRHGLRTLLAAYDPDFLVDLDRGPARGPGGTGTSKADATLAGLLWQRIDRSPHCAEADYRMMEFGTRVLYCAVHRSGALHTIVARAGVPVFRSGPHNGADLDLNASTFGHYNPDFIRWARQSLIPSPDQTTLKAATAPVYDRWVRVIARSYFVALEVVRENPAPVDSLVSDLRNGTEPAARLKVALGELVSLPRPARITGDEMEYNYYTALGFWLRRSVDGSRAEFEAALRKMLQTYDPEFLTGPAGS